MSRFQPQNNNQANPNRFQFFIPHTPDVSFFSRNVNLPGITADSTSIPTNQPAGHVPVPGDTVKFDNLVVEFIVDEDYENYIAIQEWMLENTQTSNKIFSDIMLSTTTNNFNVNRKIQFVNAFPVSLDGLEYTTTTGADEPLTAKAEFEFAYYKFQPKA